jgi:hypothetical protein
MLGQILVCAKKLCNNLVTLGLLLYIIIQDKRCLHNLLAALVGMCTMLSHDQWSGFDLVVVVAQFEGFMVTHARNSHKQALKFMQ